MPDPKPSPSLPLIIALRRPPLWPWAQVHRPPSWLWLSVLPTFTLWAFVAYAIGQVVPPWWRGHALPAETLLVAWSAGGLFAVWLLMWSKRFVVRAWPAVSIVVDEAHVRLPTGPTLIGSRQVAYGDIIAVHEVGLRAQRGLLIESRRHSYALPYGIFASAVGPAHLLAGLRLQILALPQGASLLEQTEDVRRRAQRLFATPPWASHAIFGTAAVFFINAWLKGALDVPFGLMRWGALVPTLVARGEIWRLLSATFLHSHWAHALVNGSAFLYLGGRTERMLGWPRFVTLYGLSGAAAMAASTFASRLGVDLMGGAVLSVGASGGIFGLLAAFALASWRLRTQLPLAVRQTPHWWLAILAINLLVPIYFPSIDLVAHVAGLLAGALLTWALLGRRPTLPDRAGRVLVGTAAVVIGLYAAALAQAMWHAARAEPNEAVQLAQGLATDPSASAATLKAMAWLWAVDPRSGPTELDAARQTAEAAVARRPADEAAAPGLYDTLAVVELRRGATEAAAGCWRTAVELTQDMARKAASHAGLEVRLEEALYVSRLAAALLRADPAGPIDVTGWPATAPRPHVLRREGGVWRLEAPGPLLEDTVVYAVLSTDSKPAALVQIWLAAHTTPPWTAPAEALAQYGELQVGRLLFLGVGTRPHTINAAASAGAWSSWPLADGR